MTLLAQSGIVPLSQQLVQAMVAGDRRALAQLISLAEQQSASLAPVMQAISPRTGRAFTVGLTGPPGGGKSTLVDRLTRLLRSDGLKVAILAVDPTSPFSGGAVLGDRIRMQRHYNDDGVFIRSMATRGSLGGLPVTASAVIKLLDASGADWVLVETVGVGQTERDILEMVDTLAVILVPEAGDGIQTMKAGLLELADILVVNKADRPGVLGLARELEVMLELAPPAESRGWQVPVLLTEANVGKGVEQLYKAFQEHRTALEANGELGQRRKSRRREEFLRTVTSQLSGRLEDLLQRDETFRSYLSKVEEELEDPYVAALQAIQDRKLMESWFALLERDQEQDLPTSGAGR